MDIVSIFYAALGYLALVVATLSAMLFVGDGSGIAMMDAVKGATLAHAVFIDGALLGLLALLNGMVNRTMKRKLPQRLERGTHAWLASLTVLVLFCAWRAAPQVLWSLSGPSTVLFSISFYVGWTLAL